MGRRGPPRKVMHKNPVVDAELHKPHESWDFTDPSLYAQDGVINALRQADWERWCDRDGCKYLEIAGECSSTGYWHGQGRILFRRRYRLAQLKKLFPDVHWEPSVCRQDCLYLRKPEQKTVIKYDGRKQGARNIFADQRESIQEGCTLRECALEPGANWQSFRSAELLMSYFEPERPPAPRVVHLVRNADAPMPDGVYRLKDWRFWDGYDCHKHVYINNALLKLSNAQLRQVTSGAPFRVGRYRQARFDHVYISGIPEEQRLFLRIVDTSLSHDLADYLGV